ncbi:MAG: hypothetical protein WCQ49_00675 [Candidatus Saccharibacteria bacterium]
MAMHSESVGTSEKDLAINKAMAEKSQKIIGENLVDWIKGKYREGKNQRPINYKTFVKPGMFYKIITGYITKEDPNGDFILNDGNYLLKVFLFFKQDRTVKIRIQSPEGLIYFRIPIKEICLEEEKSDFKITIAKEISINE